MDVHVPAAITSALRRNGVDVLTAQEDGADRRSDPELLDRAAELGRVMVSQDDDMLAEASERQRNGVHFSGVIYAHQLRITLGQFVRDLDLLGKACDGEDVAGRVEFLPLR
jgi:hypothetical protein